jgi:hypothetical protein
MTHGWMATAFVAQAVMSVPAHSPAVALSSPADPERLSLVIADTVSETDPRRLCDQPNCTSLFLGRYRDALVLAGLPLRADFTARVEMGSPFDRPYRMVMIVEQRPGQQPLVRAMRGFNQRTGEACFDAQDIDRLNWHPQGERIVTRGNVICVQASADNGDLWRPRNMSRR